MDGAYYDDGSEFIVAECGTTEARPGASRRWKRTADADIIDANAARLKVCWNSHDALVEALNEIIEECAVNLDCNHPGDDSECGDVDDCIGCTITEIARAALLSAGVIP